MKKVDPTTLNYAALELDIFPKWKVQVLGWLTALLLCFDGLFLILILWDRHAFAKGADSMTQLANAIIVSGALFAVWVLAAICALTAWLLFRHGKPLDFSMQKKIRRMRRSFALHLVLAPVVFVMFA